MRSAGDPTRSPFWVRINRNAVAGHDDDPVSLSSHEPASGGNAGGRGLPELRLFGDMIHAALELGVKNLAFEEHEDFARIRFKVKNRWVNWQTMDGRDGRDKIVAIVFHGNNREIPEEPVGMFYVNFKDVNRDWVRIRLNWIFSDAGYQLGMLLEEWEEGFNLDLTTLGMYPEELTHFAEALRAPRGLIILAAPPQSGKTVLGYAALMYCLMHGRKIATLEAVRRFHLEGTRQIWVRSNQYVHEVLAEALRDNPEVLMVDPLAYIADYPPIMRQAEERLVICCYDSGAAVHTLAPFYSTRFGVDSPLRPPEKFLRRNLLSADLLSEYLLMIVGSRVLPRVCHNCREAAFTIPPAAMARAGLEWRDDQRARLFRGRGCEVCGDTGLNGRTGVYEVLRVSSAVRQWIDHFADMQSRWGGRIAGEARDSHAEEKFVSLMTRNLRMISIITRREGMRGLRELGLLKAVDGILRMCDVVRETPLPFDRLNPESGENSQGNGIPESGND